MSAFMCSETHIGALVRALFELDEYQETRIRGVRAVDYGWKATFSLLAEENAKSIRWRYPDSTEQSDPTPQPAAHTLSQYPTLRPVELIKAVHCYEYQACEHDGWAKSEARKLADRIIRLATYKLPGYEGAPWGVDDPEPARQPAEDQPF